MKFNAEDQRYIRYMLLVMALDQEECDILGHSPQYLDANYIVDFTPNDVMKALHMGLRVRAQAYAREAVRQLAPQQYTQHELKSMLKKVGVIYKETKNGPSRTKRA